jgi:uncharacterized membrane protein YbhN (UPF0104 family)
MREAYARTGIGLFICAGLSVWGEKETGFVDAAAAGSVSSVISTVPTIPGFVGSCVPGARRSEK